MFIRSRAPLRLGLAGGGTDVSPYCDQFGGAILNATIGHYAYASIEPLDKPGVEFTSCDQNHSAEYDSAPHLEPDGKLDLLKFVHNHAIREFNGGTPLNVRLSTRLDVPSGSGLGGSSTLVVAALKAYAEWLNYPLDDYELARRARGSGATRRTAGSVCRRLRRVQFHGIQRQRPGSREPPAGEGKRGK
jgi:D-glycero-alpha-D-manno-heptose-7-phosphate kinase